MTEMSKLNLLVQQHILEHESRLKHVDELLERARGDVGKTGGEAAVELESMKQERDQLTRQVEALKQRPAEAWSGEDFEKFGPMALWDTLAKRLERLVERMER